MLSQNVQVSTIYSLLKGRQSVFPKRSSYYHIEPIGIGTCVVESLTSYTVRLATAHQISVGSLYEFAIIPRLNKPYLYSPSHLGPASTLVGSFRNQIKTINGVGKIAGEWAELLGEMTLRRDLKYLTLLLWAEALTHSKLLRQTQAWCPACYNEMQHTTGVIYQPLIWSVNLVQICSYHRVRLVDRCPQCNRQALALARRMELGFCPRCRSWLGGIDNLLAVEGSFTAIELQWQEFISRNVGELIKHTFSESGKASKTHIAEWLQLCAYNITQGKMQRLSVLLGKSNLTVNEWYHGKVKPILYDLLRICYCLDITLVDLLTGNRIKEKNLYQARGFPQELEQVKKPRHPKPFNTSRAEKQLTKYLKISPPISMRKVSIKIGYDHSTLYRWLPDLCRKISERYREFLQAKYKRHQNKREEEIRQACSELHKQNIYISARTIAEFLGKPSYEGRRDVLLIIKETRALLDKVKK